MIPVVRGARNWSTPAATTFNLCTAKNQSVNPSPAGISPRYILTNQPVLVAASGKEVNQRNHDWVAGSFRYSNLAKDEDGSPTDCSDYSRNNSISHK